MFDDRASARGVARMPALPVERTPLGWALVEIPEAYRAQVDISDEAFANAPEQIVRLSPHTGYVRVAGQTYEVQSDPASQRWRIVPPDDAQGVPIAIEHVPELVPEVIVGHRNGVRYEREAWRLVCSCGWRHPIRRESEVRAWRDCAAHGVLREGIQLGFAV